MSDLMREGRALNVPADGCYDLPLSAGRDLDAVVAEKVMGWRWTAFGDGVRVLRNERTLMHGVTEIDGRKEHNPALPYFSADIAAAWLVVERIRATRPREEFGIGILPRVGGDVWRCCVGMTTWGDGETAPLAICRAALAATAP